MPHKSGNHKHPSMIDRRAFIKGGAVVAAGSLFLPYGLTWGSSEPADVIFQGASIITMNPGKARVQALAVRDGRIVAAGSLDVRPIIGGVWSVSDWHEAFEKMHAGEVVKSVLKPE